jgi:hypothetical protein
MRPVSEAGSARVVLLMVVGDGVEEETGRAESGRCLQKVMFTCI